MLVLNHRCSTVSRRRLAVNRRRLSVALPQRTMCWFSEGNPCPRACDPRNSRHSPVLPREGCSSPPHFPPSAHHWPISRRFWTNSWTSAPSPTFTKEASRPPVVLIWCCCSGDAAVLSQGTLAMRTDAGGGPWNGLVRFGTVPSVSSLVARVDHYLLNRRPSAMDP